MHVDDSNSEDSEAESSRQQDEAEVFGESSGQRDEPIELDNEN